MTIGVEGAASGTSRSSTFMQALTTSGADRIGLFFFEQENTSNPAKIVSSISDGTNTWTRVNNPVAWGLNNGSTEIWWAHIATAGTYTLSVTLSGTPDDSNFGVVAVSGLTNFIDPFDGTITIQPFSRNILNSNASAPVTGYFSTFNTNTIVFCIMGSNTSSTQGSAPSGWTTDIDEANFSGGLSNGLYVGHNIFTSQQAGQTVTLPSNEANFGFIIISLTDAASTQPGLTLEGANSANMSINATSGTVNVTTYGTDRILVVTVATENSTPRTVSSVTSTSGLTWTRRKQFLSNSTVYQETWWAHAHAQLTGETVTVTLSGAADGMNLGVFAVVGCNDFVDPWDTNGSLPATNSQDTSGAVTDQVTGVSTSGAVTLVFSFWSSSTNQGNPSNLTAGSGYFEDYNLYNPNPSEWNYNVVEHQVFAAPQSGISVAFGGGTNQNWGMIADALTNRYPSASVLFPGAALVGY